MIFEWFILNTKWEDVWNNFLANLVWAAFITIPIAFFWDHIKPKIQRFLGITDRNIPILSFKTEHYNEQGNGKSRVVIRNHGKEPAYNVYVFLYNHHLTANNIAVFQSLGREHILIDVLAENQEVVFEGRTVIFDSCDVTSKQEIWVEYDNKMGAHLRSRILVSTPRGDEQKLLPPKYIKTRLEMIPIDRIELDNKIRKRIIKGKRSLFSRPSLFTKMRNNYDLKIKR